MTLTDRIERVAPHGFVRMAEDQWAVAQNDHYVAPWQADTLTPAQAAAALEDCEGCGGEGSIPEGSPWAKVHAAPPNRPCPSCGSLRACVERLLGGR